MARNVSPANTARTGFVVSGEKAVVNNFSIVEPCTVCDGSDNGPPEGINDESSKLGLLMGVYGQDEWKITDQLTINAGLRFDQMLQYVDSNQLSPRLSFTYKPSENTTWHAGYARYFTPPVLVEAAPADIGLFRNTTARPPNFSMIRCCRSGRIISMPACPRRSRWDAARSHR